MNSTTTTPLPRYLRPTLLRFAGVVLPPELAELGDLDGILEHVQGSVAAMPSYVRAGLIAGITTFEVAAVAWPPGRGRPFSRLDPARAERYFNVWLHAPVGPLRELCKAVKGLFALAYYEQPALKERLGFAPDAWIAKVARDRLEHYGAEIARAEAAVTAPDVPLGTLSRGLGHRHNHGPQAPVTKEVA
jgi:hypothetical protein